MISITLADSMQSRRIKVKSESHGRPRVVTVKPRCSRSWSRRRTLSPNAEEHSVAESGRREARLRDSARFGQPGFPTCPPQASLVSSAAHSRTRYPNGRRTCFRLPSGQTPRGFLKGPAPGGLPPRGRRLRAPPSPAPTALVQRWRGAADGRRAERVVPHARGNRTCRLTPHPPLRNGE